MVLLLSAFAVAAMVLFVVANAAGGAGWSKTMRDAIKRALPNESDETREIVLAHAAYESGRGASFASRYNNPFNLTRTRTDDRAHIYQGNADWEYKSDGSRVRIGQKWRVYATLEEGIADYWAFIGNSRYGDARELLEDADQEGFVRALSRGGYFTLPVAQYIAGMNAVKNSLAREAV